MCDLENSPPRALQILQIPLSKIHLFKADARPPAPSALNPGVIPACLRYDSVVLLSSLTLLSYELKLFLACAERRFLRGAIHDSSLRCVWETLSHLMSQPRLLLTWSCVCPCSRRLFLFDEARQGQLILEVSSGACTRRGESRSNAAGWGLVTSRQQRCNLPLPYV